MALTSTLDIPKLLQIFKKMLEDRKDMSTSVMPSPSQVYFDELYKFQKRKVFHYWFWFLPFAKLISK